VKHRGYLIFAIGVLLAVANCGRRSARELGPFSIANEQAGGEYRQILKFTNGASLYFTEKDLVVWFGDGSSFVVGVDTNTGGPKSILLNRAAVGDKPAESIFDVNADGLPEIRHVRTGSKKELLYNGRWYPKENKGSNALIVIDGKEIEVRYDGHRYVRLSEQDAEGKNSAARHSAH
jgi:hypothetical protein